MANTGYDPTTGLNYGDLGFQSPQGYAADLNGNYSSFRYNAPVAFNPGDYGGQYAPGYIDFGQNYNPDPSSAGYNDYRFYSKFGEALANALPGGKISYGSVDRGALPSYSSTGLFSDPTINGVDYSHGASYANQAAHGIGTYNPQTNGVVPYTQYTEPGYRAPQYSQPDVSSSTQAYQSPDAFYYGNNGSLGSIGGTFGNNTPGQSSPFYQNEPATLTQGNPIQNLGQLTPSNPISRQVQTQPYNPGIQALEQSRSQP